MEAKWSLRNLYILFIHIIIILKNKRHKTFLFEIFLFQVLQPTAVPSLQLIHIVSLIYFFLYSVKNSIETCIILNHPVQTLIPTTYHTNCT